MHAVNSKPFANLSRENDSLQLCHERFAHQNKQYITQILRRLNIDVTDIGEDFCDGCALGKLHRLPFMKRRSQSEETGELIHPNVNGPMRPTSLG